jgi:hypothetical protein
MGFFRDDVSTIRRNEANDAYQHLSIANMLHEKRQEEQQPKPRRNLFARLFRREKSRPAERRQKERIKTVVVPAGPQDMEAVYRMTHDAYVKAGYCQPSKDGMLIHYPHLENIPETVVLVAKVDGKIVGTNSITIDGPHGLHCDVDFPDATDEVRKEGRKLGACWRIVTTMEGHHHLNIVMSLIKESLRLMLEKGVQVGLFTFNPKHVSVYVKILHMKMVAFNQGTDGLTNAPSALMRLDREDVPQRWMKHRQDDR